MKNIINWFKSHKPSKRKLIQLYSALLFNANLKGFATGKIFKGASKNLCAPGLNCYSCPGAVGACPLGSLQNSLISSNTSTVYYVFGIIMLYGLLFGRWICGFLCPFGLIQELLHKIPTYKLKKSKVTRVLSYFKYVILVFFVFLIPMAYALRKFPLPGFCKYICPAGTLEGAMGLLSVKVNSGYLRMLGPIFTWKFLLMVSFLVLCVFVFRFFCRFLCPLGAIYGFFNKFSFVGVRVDKKSCTDCGICVDKCKMDIKSVGDHECINCGECISACPAKAIEWKGGKFMISPEAAADIPENSTPEERRELERAKEERNNKIAKRNGIIKTVTAAVMVIVLAVALVYYNFIDGRDEKKPTPPSSNVNQSDETEAIGESNDPAESESEKEAPPVGTTVGSTCPELLLDIVNDGSSFSFKNYKDRVIVLNFWYTTCGPCVEELPHFNDVANEYKDSVTVIAIHLDQPWVDVESWINSEHPEWNEGNMLIGWDTDSYCQSLFDVQACPVTIIIDKDRVITHSFIGSLHREELVKAVEEALK